MKFLKYIILLLVSAGMTSCFDDTTIDDEIEATSNLVTFNSEQASFATVAGGSDVSPVMKEVNMRITGPTIENIDSDVTVNITVDPSSTAIEGVHYELPQTQITLGPDDNFLANFPISMLKDGISPPLAENPILVLNLENASGGGGVIASSKQVEINFLYLCFADLSGDYLVTNDDCSTGGYIATITANPDGSWNLTSADGNFLSSCTANTGLDNPGNINEVCGVIQPSTDLQYAPCCNIGNIQGGTWDQDNGILIMQHTQSFTGNWSSSWTSTYTRL